MKGEINKDFYCSRILDDEDCITATVYPEEQEKCANAKEWGCDFRHRKWPTPEQFEEEYGEEVPDHLPMWVWCKDKWNGDGWCLVEAWNIKLIKKTHESLFIGDVEISEDAPAVCACTPFDKPDRDWRP